jgi:uncharacterized OB-fold protein
MKCLNCGIEIAVENASNPCPNCGSLDRSVAVADEAKVFEMLTVKQNVKSHHKYDGFMQAGERIGKNGKIARIRLEIDKKNRIKHHLVEEKSEKGEWVVVHDEVEHF